MSRFQSDGAFMVHCTRCGVLCLRTSRIVGIHLSTLAEHAARCRAHHGNPSVIALGDQRARTVGDVLAQYKVTHAA